MKKKRKEEIEEEYEEPDEYFTDNYDIVKSQIKVHGKETTDALDTNFPLADFQGYPQAIQFIREQHLTAKKCKEYLNSTKIIASIERKRRHGLITEEQAIKQKKYCSDISNKLFDLIMTEMRDLAILHRNKKTNPIVRWTLKRETPEGAEKEAGGKTEGTITKIQRLIGKEKKVNEEEED